jgi:hypothetical protein
VSGTILRLLLAMCTVLLFQKGRGNALEQSAHTPFPHLNVIFGLAAA